MAVSGEAIKATGPFSPFERMMAMRYLRARRKEAFVSVIAIFSTRMPLKGVPSFLAASNRPVSASRFTYWPVLGLKVWVFPLTAPMRWPLPVLVAIID